MEAKGGEIVGLLGPNGAGKTTSFSMIAGFTRPTSGSLSLDGVDLTRLPPHQRARRGLVYLPRNLPFSGNSAWRITLGDRSNLEPFETEGK